MLLNLLLKMCFATYPAVRYATNAIIVHSCAHTQRGLFSFLHHDAVPPTAEEPAVVPQGPRSHHKIVILLLPIQGPPAVNCQIVRPTHQTRKASGHYGSRRTPTTGERSSPTRAEDPSHSQRERGGKGQEASCRSPIPCQ